MASAHSSEFLPVRLAADRQEPLGAPAVLDALDLGRGRWLIVLEPASGLLASAVVGGSRRPPSRAGGGRRGGGTPRQNRDGRRRARVHLPATGHHRPVERRDTDRGRQSNESILVGGKAVVKRLVWTAPGNARPMVLPTHIVAAGFDEMPAPLGNAGWQHDDGVAPLTSISSYLPGARDGWDWYVELLERSLEGRSLDAVEPAAALGAITARLHGALATPTDVLPAPSASAGEDTVGRWRRSAEADLEAAISSIDGDEGARLRERAGAVREELHELRSPETISIPIHGDLHVGQFLKWSGGLAVSDLDGDPLGPGTLEGSPAKDVASLVQSLDHVGRIVERRRGGSVAGWIREASDACLEAYRHELAALGASALFDQRLLRPLSVAQELHEFVYADRYLPSWRYVPDRALSALLDAAS